MRTTLNIDDSLLLQAKHLAAKEHTSLTRVIEQGLMLRLHQQSHSAQRAPLPVYHGQGGLCPGVGEGTTNRALLDAMDETP